MSFSSKFHHSRPWNISHEIHYTLFITFISLHILFRMSLPTSMRALRKSSPTPGYSLTEVISFCRPWTNFAQQVTLHNIAWPYTTLHPHEYLILYLLLLYYICTIYHSIEKGVFRRFFFFWYNSIGKEILVHHNKNEPHRSRCPFQREMKWW